MLAEHLAVALLAGRNGTVLTSTPAALPLVAGQVLCRLRGVGLHKPDHRMTVLQLETPEYDGPAQATSLDQRRSADEQAGSVEEDPADHSAAASLIIARHEEEAPAGFQRLSGPHPIYVRENDARIDPDMRMLVEKMLNGRSALDSVRAYHRTISEHGVPCELTITALGELVARCEPTPFLSFRSPQDALRYMAGTPSRSLTCHLPLIADSTTSLVIHDPAGRRRGMLRWTVADGLPQPVANLTDEGVALSFDPAACEEFHVATASIKGVSPVLASVCISGPVTMQGGGEDAGTFDYLWFDAS